MIKRLRSADPILLLLLGIALVLRLWYLGVHNGRSAFFADEGDYYARAIRLAFGSGYVDDFWLIRPPLVVWWLAGLFKASALLGIPEHSLTLVRLVQIALSLGVLVLLYDTGRLLYGRAAGRWAAAGWALIFSFVRLPSLLLVENLFLALISLIFWALVRYERARGAEGTGRRGPGVPFGPWLAVAGIALGIAALSRSTLLWYLPVVLLWIWRIERRRSPGAGRLAGLPVTITHWLLLAGLAVLIIAPWTLRNYRLYQSFIPVDTMLGANLWLDADEVDSRRGDNPKIVQLEAIGDPVARDAYGRQQGLRIIMADPAAKLRRSLAQLQHGLRLEYIANFFDRPSLDSEPLRRVLPLALLGDLLTVLVLLAMIWGAFSPRTDGPFKLGLLFWLALNLAAIVVFHSETRYLLPIYHGGLLLGGAALAHGRQRVGGWRGIAAAGVMAVLLLTIVTYKNYVRLIVRGLEREIALDDGWLAYAAGDMTLALAGAQQAAVADPDFDEPRWLVALAQAERDGPDAGLAAINPLLATNSREPHARLIRFELLRRLGRAAEAEDDASQAEVAAPDDLLAWSWDALRSPPTTTLTLDGNAAGHIRGWWPAENGTRTATGHADVRLFVPSGDRPELRLRVRAPADLPAGEVRIFAGGMPVTSFIPQVEWVDLTLALPREFAGHEIVFSFVGPTVVVAGGPPGTDMLRLSGIEISRVATQ